MDCLGEPAIPGEITLSATAVTKEGVFAAYISPVPGAKRYEWKVPLNWVSTAFFLLFLLLFYIYSDYLAFPNKEIQQNPG
jgi:hypothetical protein